MYYTYNDYDEVWAAEINALVRDVGEQSMSGTVIYGSNFQQNEDKVTPERMLFLVDSPKNTHPYFFMRSVEHAVNLSKKKYGFYDFCADSGYFSRAMTKEFTA